MSVPQNLPITSMERARDCVYATAVNYDRMVEFNTRRGLHAEAERCAAEARRHWATWEDLCGAIRRTREYDRAAEAVAKVLPVKPRVAVSCPEDHLRSMLRIGGGRNVSPAFASFSARPCSLDVIS